MMIYTTRDGTILDLTTPEGLRGLRIEIAKQLGWRPVGVVTWDAELPMLRNVKFERPDHGLDDASVSMGAPQQLSEDEMWDCGLRGDPECGESLIPRYTTDANDAFALLDDLRATIYKQRDILAQATKTQGYIVKIEWGVRVSREIFSPEYCPTPALAICLAWLAYKDADGTP